MSTFGRIRAARWLALVVVVATLVGGCRSGAKGAGSHGDEVRTVQDGIYLVLRRSEDPAALEPMTADEMLVRYDRRFLPPDALAPPEALVLPRRPAVRLDLAAPPEGDVTQACSVPVQIQLGSAQADALERFTRDNEGRSVAVVVGGEVATVHKIRTTVVGGRLQITCCSEGACGFLLSELADNLVSD